MFTLNVRTSLGPKHYDFPTYDAAMTAAHAMEQSKNVIGVCVYDTEQVWYEYGDQGNSFVQIQS